ncbi:MAG: hypothetical protein WBZ39_10975, partial [Methylovirgula sp.]
YVANLHFRNHAGSSGARNLARRRREMTEGDGAEHEVREARGVRLLGTSAIEERQPAENRDFPSQSEESVARSRPALAHRAPGLFSRRGACTFRDGTPKEYALSGFTI